MRARARSRRCLLSACVRACCVRCRSAHPSFFMLLYGDNTRASRALGALMCAHCVPGRLAPRIRSGGVSSWQRGAHAHANRKTRALVAVRIAVMLQVHQPCPTPCNHQPQHNNRSATHQPHHDGVGRGAGRRGGGGGGRRRRRCRVDGRRRRNAGRPGAARPGSDQAWCVFWCWGEESLSAALVGTRVIKQDAGTEPPLPAATLQLLAAASPPPHPPLHANAHTPPPPPKQQRTSCASAPATCCSRTRCSRPTTSPAARTPS